MSAIVRWTLRIAAGLIGIGLVLIGLVYGISSRRISRTWHVDPDPVPAPADSAAIARGEHIATIRGCPSCHGDGLRGGVFFDEPIFGRLYAPNLTRGRGGVGGQYAVIDWIRAVRHGLRPSGKPLMFMPAQDFAVIGDGDIGDLIAWIRSRPPIDNERTFENSIGPLGRLLFVTGKLPLVPAELIDHRTGPVASPAPGPTAEYGRYLATVCRGCHRDNYSGGPMPGAGPGDPPAANLTRDATGLAAWSEEDFSRALHTGLRPDGRQLDVAKMPWSTFSKLTDTETEAIWRFLQSLPPLPKGS
jgi:mono/diheme cytochrome c family protein